MAADIENARLKQPITVANDAIEVLPLVTEKTIRDLSISVLNIKNIAFYGCSEIVRTRTFKIFTVYAIIFRQFMATFHFF